jgi:ComF family protein
LNLFPTILKSGLDFLLPQMCLLCNKEIEKGMICDNCLNYLPLVEPPVCRHCGRPITKGTICEICRESTALDRGRAWLLFVPPTDRLIHHFKYRKNSRLAQMLGRAMAALVSADHTLAHADLITFVPLFWWKHLRRGYNQASLLARLIGQETGISVQPILKRVRNTRTQTRLNTKARQKNVRNAFAVHGTGIRERKVILVDDVLTTGATINECARVLKEAGAAEVYSCVAAITPLRTS